MKLHLFLLLIFTPAVCGLEAQCSEDVKAIVSAVEKKISGSDVYSVDFDLELAYVGEPTQKQSGQLVLSGNKFSLRLPDQTFINDGQALYIVLDEAREVQVLPLEEASSTQQFSPVQILNFYCSDEYLAAIQGTLMEGPQKLTQIEFTPIDKSNDVFKVRVNYDSNSKEITQVKTFEKDGSRMTLMATGYNYSPQISGDPFKFDPSLYSGYNIEDLR